MGEPEDNWWQRWHFRIFLLSTLIICCGPVLSSAEGHVGCLFVDSLCIDDVEWCFDDYVFGKCVSQATVNEEEFDRSPLTEEQSRSMAVMLEELQGAGLGWDHPFVQCRIQGALYSIRHNTPLPQNLCVNLAPDPEIFDPQSPLAFVRFTPPSDDYADEVYFPPPKKGFDDRLYRNPPEVVMHHETPPRLPENLEIYPESSIADSERNEELKEELATEELADRIKDIVNRIELRRMLARYESGKLSPPVYLNDQVLPENYLVDENVLLPNEYKENNKRTEIEPVKTEDNELPTTFFREMARNEHVPLKDADGPYNHYQANSLDALMPVYRVPKEHDISDDYINLNSYPVKHGHGNKAFRGEGGGVYTEGGLVYVPERNEEQELERKQEARNLLANMLGFTRHERLDVKKPGPLVGPPPSAHNSNDMHEIGDNSTTPATDNKEVLPKHIKGDDETKVKKDLSDHADEEHAPHIVDTDYAHVILKNPLDNWQTGARIVSNLADILHMQNYFTHPRVDRHEVSFRVEPNPEKKTAADVARAINDARLKNNLYRRLGVTVILAGVGDKTKDDSSVVTASKIGLVDEGPDVTHIMAYMFAGAGAAAVVVIVITLFLIRRHDKKRDKLGGLQAGLSGAESCSKDYQELCRARMAGKGTTSEAASSGRIMSLSKENERPPSSRSSTSSWSEEPALTNMDISTGHMVLSYMEDHLRNKGRLQREWEALCRYEAEPSAREAALQSQCAPLNRSTAPLPFDHSRVVLNHLANAEGLDYINASTITDHDPRAPAYIAAQGPLPTTLAHFWQMIWEQGAVVIVALCRLQENGEIACARYWPEEGAEVYHIYEVHLVSEHIWCDDYLVRSFYLKNLRTSETRTVTQFHFLSWPPSGVPSSAKALLEFRRKVNKSYRGRSCPIVVHGSNGAGRTGAYILLDLVLGRMNKGAREIDIAATLEHLRDQRGGLVTTRQQFEFVLMAVAEEVHAILKALPANSQGEKRELDKEPVKEEETQSTEDEKAKSEETPENDKAKKTEK
ncbi:receptor-type tyrosine-protein phosphatase N2 [Hermetia illucens]|uniref:receptor-type tyrosine-protein phosphatase N2 n=1 Tax=Hermetia illucens TaxID=343691 RepID=UPI0018CC72B0|nr:receptor-type tyrosine-protein phosphatase N2 [Hermetia illucens]XP_037919659.1 receptor-type tyrosine-protein phosphatase N2 [Hermetia illucens]